MICSGLHCFFYLYFLCPVLKRVFISVINDLATDQRVGRIARLLADRGFDVQCIGRRLKESPEMGTKSFGIRRFRMLITGGPLFYAFFNLRLMVSLLFTRKPVLLIANDLDTLPANYIVSRLRRLPIIYDSHELFTQVPELIHRPFVQSVWKWIERKIVPELEYAVTVNYSIATIYRRLYGTRFRVVRNLPERIESLPRERDTSHMQTIIYQGALNIGRGLELMIDVMAYLEDVKFVVAGKGDIEEELKKLVHEKNLDDRIEFFGRLMPEELVRVTSSADLGISLEEDRGLSYRYTLPNKLFDYIQCQIPVLCSKLPEMSRIVDSYGVGISTAERAPEKLAEIIRFMLRERSGGAWREALRKAARDLCWENESNIYLDLLQEAGVLD
jgi:glycosyltransferase involved in cell wall biosynthesis